MLIRFSEHRFTLLLATLFLLLLLTPAVHELRDRDGGIWGTGLVALLFTLVVVAAVSAICRTRKTMAFAIVLAGPAILLRVVDLFFQNDLAEATHLLTGALFVAFAIVLILKYLFEANRISLNAINASLCVYMLLGVLWANLFVLVARFDPTAFSTPASASTELNATVDRAEQYIGMLYYSFTTLTTLGYGDITPSSAFARMLAITEAIVGQIILVVLVARLVGMHVALSANGQRERRRRSQKR